MAIFSRNAQALLLLVGTIVGVGMFGIPFVFVRAGFLTGVIELAILAAAAALVHFAYAEVVLATPELHRLPGYVRRYLGPTAGQISRLSYLAGLSGSLLAYIVLGGFFLQTLLGAVFPETPPMAGLFIFYTLGVFVLFQGIRFESAANALLTLILLGAVAALAFTLVPASSLPALSFYPERFPIPYGVILFSMAGAAVIPEMRRILGRASASRLRSLTVLGTFAASILYLLFAAVVVGVSGPATTPDAITGLAERFGSFYLLSGSVIGFLTAITSFIPLAMVLQGMFISDVGLPERAAWLLTAIIPASLYLAGFHDFIAIVSVVGAVAIGFDSLLVLLVHRRAVRQARLLAFAPAAASDVVRLLLVCVFGFGILYELYRFFAL